MVDVNRHKLFLFQILKDIYDDFELANCLGFKGGSALLNRNTIINRDIFDCWFFMKNQMPVNKRIVEFRMKMTFQDYLEKCIELLDKRSDKQLLNGLGELMDEQTKTFVRTKLRTETIRLLKFYKDYPVLS